MSSTTTRPTNTAAQAKIRGEGFATGRAAGCRLGAATLSRRSSSMRPASSSARSRARASRSYASDPSIYPYLRRSYFCAMLPLILSSEFLRHTQLCAAGTGVIYKLRLTRHNGLAAHEPHFRFSAAHAHRKIRWAGATGGQILQGFFNDPVFQRVKADHSQPSALL